MEKFQYCIDTLGIGLLFSEIVPATNFHVNSGCRFRYFANVFVELQFKKKGEKEQLNFSSIEFPDLKRFFPAKKISISYPKVFKGINFFEN